MSTENTPDAIWKLALGELKYQMIQATYDRLFYDAVLIEQHADLWRIGVRDQQVLEWVENRMHDTVARTLSALTGYPVKIEFTTVAQTNVHVPSANGNGQAPPDNWQEDDWHVAQQVVVDRQRRPPQRQYIPEEQYTKPVEYRNIRPPTDPLKGHVDVSHYAIRFWQAMVGRDAFGLWLLISSYAYEFEELGKDPPTIKALANKMGYSRTDPLTGRAKNPVQYGLLNVLRDHRICDHKAVGKGRGQRQVFDHLTRINHAPLLTPYQVEKFLDSDTQEEHLEWLRLHTAVDLDEWQADERNTRIPEFPVEETS